MEISDEIIDGCINNQRKSQEILYKKTYSYMMSICFRYTNCPETSKELVNDAFLKILKNIHTFKKEYPFKSWMSKIVVNTIIDHLRSIKMKQEIIKDSNYQDEYENNYYIFNEALSKLNIRDLYELLSKLNPTEKAVFNLFAIDGFSHKEISQKLDISEELSRWYLKTARQKLKKWLVRDYKNMFYVA
jgi:RNA polymerase sigma-70 factor (ECF subfamily)